MNRKIEFIEEYIKVGNSDYKWNDNHGELVRCKDCKHFEGEGMYCAHDIIVQYDHFYCYHGERRDDETD